MWCESFEKLSHVLHSLFVRLYVGRVGLLTEQSVRSDTAVHRGFSNETGLCKQETMTQVHVIERAAQTNSLVLEDSGTRANVCLLNLTDKV